MSTGRNTSGNTNKTTSSGTEEDGPPEILMGIIDYYANVPGKIASVNNCSCDCMLLKMKRTKFEQITYIAPNERVDISASKIIPEQLSSKEQGEEEEECGVNCLSER